MKKKVITIIIALVLVFAVSATAFAAASDRAKDVTEENQGRALGIEKQDRGGEKLKELFATYYEEGLEQFEANREAHRDFHESAKENAEATREAVQADFDAIKENIENGSISKRDGRVQMITLRMEIRLMRNEFDAIRLDKIDAQAPVHDRLAEIRQEMKELLETEPVDGDAVALLLEESLGLFEEHLENDIYYHGLMMDAAAGYGY